MIQTRPTNTTCPRSLRKSGTPITLRASSFDRILAALIERRSSGLGQAVSCAIHEAVAKNTELDLMSWVMRRAPLYRLTCRHASETVTRVPSISHTKDGRWFMTWGVGSRDRANLAPFLDRYGMAADLRAPKGLGDVGARNIPGTAAADETSSHRSK